MPAKKKTAKRRTRRRAPSRRAPARRTTRRRRKNPGTHARRSPTRRRRTANPSLRGGLNSVLAEFKHSLPRVLGAISAGYVAQQVGKRWGNASMFGDKRNSTMLGDSWSWQQYAGAAATAAWGPMIVSRFLNPTEFRRGAVDLITYKVAWTEVISRSEWAQKNFGNGEIAYDPSVGQMYMNQGGNYAAMQGYMGNLVEASPMDGLGNLVEASPMDGMGHLMPPDTPARVAEIGRNSGSGYTSNYHAAFSK